MHRSALAIAVTLGWTATACSESEPSSVHVTPTEAAPSDAAAPAQAEAPAEPETLDRGDGLTVEVLQRGQGPEARLGCELLVHFTSRVDGVEEPFDSTYSRGLPDRWRLSSSASPRLIEGLVRGLEGLPAGSRAVLHIPAALGYGAEGRPGAGIPADSALVYEVQLIDVRP